MKIKRKYFLFAILIICLLIASVGCGKTNNLSSRNNKNVENKTTQSSKSNNNVSSQISDNESKVADNSAVNSSKNNTNSQNELAVTNAGNNQSNISSTSKDSGDKQSSLTTKSDVQQSQPSAKVSTPKAPALTPKAPTPAPKTSAQAVKTPTPKTSTQTIQTFKGYITTEDDFAAGLKEDTASMIYMRLMALSGLGITFEQNGQWVFYYFDGNISTDNKGSDGKWVFNGKGSQLSAWEIVEAQVKENNGSNKMKAVPVTVTGILNGNTKTNPGPDADGKYFKVITVKSISKNP
ncbi:hypothetical protein OSC52_18220 [Clostridium pasteurianum]|uniref:hypothetical protein n=1 Tax=Clostridium pasteurianum TaxID=1501 RepID=UPI002260A8ED|nr:hypothetical protein [Clostridium pasteurianum]UZW13748.1 hypothetical protein OSC52_18220 [Clostridium pasteurianum]